uniref:Uncharacterized LOC107752134 n=1 Tax=Sinocyclocheilus rhinocerous TaxID=307959 RepID=A0A673IZ63_9TELE
KYTHFIKHTLLFVSHMSVFFLSVSLRPKFPEVYVGDDVTLICNHKGGSKPTKWFINGKVQPHEDYSMLLIAVTPENNGMYECEQAGSKSDPYTLTVLELMVMLVPPAVPALQGEPVALRCVVWGGPKLEQAVFYKDSKKIESTSEGTYTITNATQSDNGKYSCHATYRYSHISAEAVNTTTAALPHTFINTEPLILHVLTKKASESIFWTWYHGVFYNIHANLSYVITLKKTIIYLSTIHKYMIIY